VWRLLSLPSQTDGAGSAAPERSSGTCRRWRFLSDDERRTARQQWLALQGVPTGPNYLAARGGRMKVSVSVISSIGFASRGLIRKAHDFAAGRHRVVLAESNIREPNRIGLFGTILRYWTKATSLLQRLRVEALPRRNGRSPSSPATQTGDSTSSIGPS
jgi:hypothetical protein